MSKRLQRIVPFLIAIYFAYFAWGAMSAKFAVDDPENLAGYWRRGLGRVMLDNVRFWSTAYRPMGGLFYLPIYDGFHLHPLAYRIAILAIVAANVALTWVIAQELSHHSAAAALAAMLVCAHAAMLTIYYNTSMIYDVLAFFFTAVMLAVYLRVRGRGDALGPVQMAIVLLAYIAAIDSKEIAVVGAGWILGYEILVARRRRWATPALLMAIGLIYSAGKMWGPDSLSKVGGYELEFTPHRFLVDNEAYWNSLFYTQYFHNSRRLLIGFCLLTVLCALYRRREVWWCWFVASTATLATSFTVVPRDGGSLYLPLLAWALLVSLMATAILARPGMQWAVVGLIAILWSGETIRQWRQVAPAYLQQQELTWSVIRQMGSLPAPAPNSRVMILNSPFAGWDAYFIAELLWNDRSIEIEMGDKLAVPPAAGDLKKFQMVMAFEGNRLLVKRP